LSYKIFYIKGPYIKYIRSQGRRGIFPVRTFYGQGGRRGSSDADVRTFWCKKLRIF